MKIDLQILESESQISSSINKALLPQVKTYMNDGVNEVKKILPSYVNSVVTNSREYNSLISGKLRYNLGIPDAGDKLAGLIQLWTSNIEYLYLPPNIIGDEIKSSFRASLFRIDFSDVLYSSYAQVFDNERGYILPWLIGNAISSVF